MLGAIVTVVFEMIVSYMLTMFTGSVVVSIASFAIFWLLMICCGVVEIEVTGRLIDKFSNGIFLVTATFAPVIIGAYIVL